VSDDLRQHHDMGGQVGGEPAGPIDRTGHEEADWEKELEAVVSLLTGYKTRTMRVDELRRHIESLPPDVYDSAGYYGRWALAVTNFLVEKGILDRNELDARVKAKSDDPDILA
jgi:hypothetical protein